MEENDSFVNGLDLMCAFAWALMKLTELIRKQGKAAWGFGGLSLDEAILVQELVMFLLSVYACSVLRQPARLPEYTSRRSSKVATLTMQTMPSEDIAVQQLTLTLCVE